MALKSICVNGSLGNLSRFIAEENINLGRGNWNIRLDCFSLTSSTRELKTSIKICSNLVQQVQIEKSRKIIEYTPLAIENVHVTKGEQSSISHTSYANEFQVTNKLDKIEISIFDLYSGEALISNQIFGHFRFLFHRTE
jgi:hypothetical protein